MTRDQLIRLFFRLMKTVPIVELHQAIRYAFERPSGSDETSSPLYLFAVLLVDDVNVLAEKAARPPSFPPRA